MLSEEAAEQSETTFVGLLGTDEALPGERNCGNGGGTRESRVHPFCPRAILHRLHVPRHRAERDTLRERKLSHVDVHESARRKRARKRAHDAGRVKSGTQETAPPGCTESRATFKPDDTGCDRFRTGCVPKQPNAEHCRHYTRRQMDGAGQIGIVVIESMDEHCVHQHRIPQRQCGRHADDLEVTRPSAVTRGQRPLRELVLGRRKTNTDRVE